MSKNWTDIISVNNMAKFENSKISYKKIISLRKDLGNKLLACKTLKEVLDISFKAIELEIFPQVTSIFLFLKESYIERVERYGMDEDGNPIEQNWFPNEKYKPGESFSGLAVKSSESSIYGESFLCKDISEKFHTSSVLCSDSNGDLKYDLKYREQYKEKLGFLKSGISVPLNGTHRTIGTIEVLNKVDPKTLKPDRKMTFSEEELCWLTVVGAHVSSAISRLRKTEEDKIISFISSQLVRSHENQDDKELVDVYESVAQCLVNHKLMPYKACIIRVLEENLIWVSKLSANI